jgi:choline dehydrogenase-like flavoprotein
MAINDKSVPPSLLDDLQLALGAADYALSKAKTPEENREATLLALKAVYDFHKSAGLKSSALRNLSMALQDIERGRAPALFQPSRQHRPKEAAKQFILKSGAAAALQLLIDSGRGKKEASAIVARRLALAGFSLAGVKSQPPNARTIARWRDRFSGHSDEEGADTYKIVLEEARGRFATPAEQAEQVMQGFKRLVRNLEKPPS